MDEGATERAGSGRGERCLDVETLDRLVRDPGLELDSESARHLEVCEACRDRLAEMRRDDQFLERFRSSQGEAGGACAPGEGLVRVDGYRVLGLIAYGGQGAVYRGVQQGTGREVAIKVPIGDALRRPSTRYRFEREIELTARLDHPGIVRVLGACTLADGRLGCVMDFVDGEPFDSWASVKRERGDTRGVVEAVARVADAIAYAHQRAVIHRDIKPSNVVVTRDGAPRVLDFGLAKAIGESGSSFATVTGAFVGTLIYSAPEQIAAGAGSTDLRTDVYALGLLLFQGLTGGLPYDPDLPPGELVRQIREMSAVRASSLRPGIGRELDAVVARAMSRDPERRYQSAAEFRDDLVAWLEGRAVRARNDSRWYVLRKSAWRHRRPIALVTTLILALGAVGVSYGVSRSQIARAEFADAVRDARTVESHWARMSELRAIGLDNFEAGEFGAWDALLEPDAALIEHGVEGTGAVPRSPAYWALWEMYQNSPVIFSVPSLERSLSTLDPATGAVVKLSAGTGSLRWWDPVSGELIRELPIESDSGATSLNLSPDGRLAAMTLTDGRLLLLDTRRGTVHELDRGAVSFGSRITGDRLLSGVREEDGSGVRVKIWDLHAGPPSLIAVVDVSGPIRNTVIDSSMAFAAVLVESGDLTVIALRDGRTLLQRSNEVQPRFLMVQTRGIPGEFLLFGGAVVMTLDMHVGGGRFEMLSGEDVFSDGARQIEHARETDRIVTVTDRYRIEIGSNTSAQIERVFPAMSVSTVSIAADGAIASGLARPSGRSVAIETEAQAIRRLPFPADVSESGFATVPSVCFTEDSSALIAGGMDGSVRCFDTREGVERWRIEGVYANGINVMRPMGDDLYIGSHDLGLDDATFGRIRDGLYEELVAGPNRWYSGLEADPDGRLWALTGEGRLMRVDGDHGAIVREVMLEKHPENATIRALARLEQHGVLVAGPAGSGVVLLDEETLEPVGVPVEMAPIRELAVSPSDPGLLATAGDDGVVRLWRYVHVPGSPRTLELVNEMGTHAGPIFCIAFSPDGKQIATGGGSPERRDVRIWDVEHGRELASLNLFELGVFGLAFSPDGRWLAASGEVDPSFPEAGGELYMIDLRAADRCIAGNLEYHIARFIEAHGREPEQGEALKAWADTVR